MTLQLQHPDPDADLEAAYRLARQEERQVRDEMDRLTQPYLERLAVLKRQRIAAWRAWKAIPPR